MSLEKYKLSSLADKQAKVGAEPESVKVEKKRKVEKPKKVKINLKAKKKKR